MSGVPWTFSKVTFKTRGELENAIEALANGKTADHVQAAKNLVSEAQAARVLSTDQCQTIKRRLHL